MLRASLFYMQQAQHCNIFGLYDGLSSSKLEKSAALWNLIFSWSNSQDKEEKQQLMAGN